MRQSTCSPRCRREARYLVESRDRLGLRIAASRSSTTPSSTSSCSENMSATPKKYLDLTGMRFGKLLIIKRATTSRGHGKEAWWVAICSCKKARTVCVRGSSLRRGHTRSCGCVQEEVRRVANLQHGHAGKTRSPEYATWLGIVARCTNPNCKDFKKYGQRGIGLHEPWRKAFHLFLRAVGPKPGPNYQIDRIDNKRGYVPGNVRWVTPIHQQRNRSNLRLITFRQQTRCLSAWAESLGISGTALAHRLKHWTKANALTRTPRKQRNRAS